MTKIVRLAPLVLGGVIVAACNSPERDWKSAVELDTVESYQAYLARHPQGEFAGEARRRLAPLEWNAANDLGTVDGYRRFLERYPDGPTARAAQVNIDMADKFAVRLVSAGKRHGTSCGGPGIAAVVDVRTNAPNTTAVVSQLAVQARSDKPTWARLQRFAVLDARNVSFGSGPVTTCMDLETEWKFGERFRFPRAAIPLHFLDSAATAGPQAERGEFTMTFGGAGSALVVLVFEGELPPFSAGSTASGTLQAIRGFGQTLKIAATR